MVLELRLGDVLRLKKTHPCGSDFWVVVRLGADIGIRCRKCDRRVLLQRSYLERRVKEVVRDSEEAGP
jgi:hypothetical protein